MPIACPDSAIALQPRGDEKVVSRILRTKADRIGIDQTQVTKYIGQASLVYSVPRRDASIRMDNGIFHAAYHKELRGHKGTGSEKGYRPSPRPLLGSWLTIFGRPQDSWDPVGMRRPRSLLVLAKPPYAERRGRYAREGVPLAGCKSRSELAAAP